jgi:signal peptidase
VAELEVAHLEVAHLEVAHLEMARLLATTQASAPESSLVRHVAVPRFANGAPTSWLRVAFFVVLTGFVSMILASYAVPLWFQVRGERLLVVTSGSMSPEIEVGDAVVIQQVTSASQLRVGQIVTFYPTKSTVLITHRIVGLTNVDRVDDAGNPVLAPHGKPLNDPFIKTKGDANKTVDPNLTPATQVRGIVREIYPRWGFGLAWAHSGVGRLFLFGPPLLALAISELMSRSGTSIGDLLARLPRRTRRDTDEPTADEGDPDAPDLD